MKMKTISIHTEYIKLDQLLKLGNYVNTGGTVKALLQEGVIKVNNKTEQRRGKKIYPGDVVEISHTDVVKVVYLKN